MTRSPVGSSSAPAAMLIVSESGASQKRLEPHELQKPRRAPVSLSGLSTQVRVGPSTTRSCRRAAVAANRWPLQRRHSRQWQISRSP